MALDFRYRRTGYRRLCRYLKVLHRRLARDGQILE